MKYGIVFLLLLSSCTSTLTLPPPVEKVTFPPALTKECEAPAELVDDTMGALAETLISNTSRLNDCATAHRLLVQAVTEK